MFWKSIIAGFELLSYWEVWIAVILYVVLNFSFLMVVALIAGGEEYGGRMATGCLFHMIGGTVLHGIMMGIMVAFLLPIMLGGQSAAPLSGIISLLWPIVKVGVIAIVAVTIVGFIPLIGSFVAGSPGIQAFLEGFIIFRLLSGSLIEEIVAKLNIEVGVYPGFWESIGFLVIAAILVRLLMFGFGLLAVALEGTAMEELMPVVIGPAWGTLGGIVPLFMYTSYVRLTIMQALTK